MRDGALPGDFVGHLFVADTGNDENGVCAVGFGVAQGLQHALQAFLARFFVGMREGLLPMRVAAHAGGLEAGFTERIEHLLLIHAALGLDAFVSGIFGGLQTLHERAFDAERAEHDGFFQFPRCGGCQRAMGDGGTGKSGEGGGAEEVAARGHGGWVGKKCLHPTRLASHRFHAMTLTIKMSGR